MFHNLSPAPLELENGDAVHHTLQLLQSFFDDQDFVRERVIAVCKNASNPRSKDVGDYIPISDSLVTQDASNILSHDTDRSLPNGVNHRVPENLGQIQNAPVLVVLTVTNASQAFHRCTDAGRSSHAHLRLHDRS
ncbi:hypothetical protein NW754_015173 [Fusarium falciforme]|nr:hypothetical protein NW754_015173 [Fusarium falciforme]